MTSVNNAGAYGLAHSSWSSRPFAAVEHPAEPLYAVGDMEVIMTELFDPAARKVYETILAATAKFGAVTAEEKKTSVHLVAKTGFAGVHPRKGAVLLNIRSDSPIKSERIRKLEQVSAKRYHNEMLIDTPAGVDSEVVGWLQSAYALSVEAK